MIKAGYMLVVESWENDGDNYKEQIVDGLTKYEVSWYLKFLEYFRTRGNEEISDQQLQELVDTLKYEFGYVPTIIAELKRSFDLWENKDDEDLYPDYRDLVHKLLGQASEGYDYYFARVYESHKIYYIPEDLEDLSSEF